MINETPSVARSSRQRLGLASAAMMFLLASCGSAATDEATDVTETTETVETTAPSSETEPGDEATTEDEPDAEPSEDADDAAEAVEAGNPVDLDLFFDGAFAEDVTIVDCTLNGGAETSCYSMTITGYPASYDVGPFCPTSTSDTAESGGIWFDGTGLYDIDGEFILSLATLYDDDNWLMYDADGNVMVTETAEEFEGAARPDVDEALQNHCVEGRLEWLPDGEPITSTVVIPVTPIAADNASQPNGNSGVTLDGVVIAEAAPVAAILSAYTIAAFDDCGGHFNPFEGYHLHGAVGCSENGETVDSETPIFGYAMDGYPVHSPLDDDALAAADLDECNGHTTEEAGYHYHANSAEQNNVISCLVGQSVAGDQRGGPPPD